MAHPGQTESDSVPIWLKLSDADAARMDQVLARPEFAGWTRAEWCLEVIQTALRYYTRARPDAEPGQERGAARPASAEPVPEPEPAASEPVPEPEPAASEPELAAPEPEFAAPEPVQTAAEPPARPQCSHPAEARDYQSGTCGACGAILWD